MIEPISLVVGGVLRFIPEVMKLWDRQKERAHERTMFDLQLQADKLRADVTMQTLEKRGEIEQQLAELNAMVAATQAQANVRVQRTGNRFIDGVLALVEVFSATVRPAVTYWLVALYSVYKVASYELIVAGGADWKAAITALWTPQDEAIFASVLAFWFVDRALRKLGRP